ncbi:MAG: UDP-glucose/GDP-mannose dehydrogenase family protein [Nitrospirae bacterium]|nr:UDP-glucose/GDP-mannose dehydrogenase family protein [Nitrospirota bacterium]
MKICVIGTGYVGLVTGTCFAEFGVDVTCVDRDESKILSLLEDRIPESKILSLLEDRIPFHEPGLEELLRKNRAEGRLAFTTDTAKAVRDSLVIFIAVGTPSRDDGSADLRYVEAVAREIGDNLNGYKVIVTKSTVPVGTGDLIRRVIMEHRKSGESFDIVSNPEFLREGSAVEDFLRPNRVVIGTESERAMDVMRDLYRPLYLIETPFVLTTVATAEMIKYASNAFLAVKISFINEVANLCELAGADVHVVARAMGLDHRIGSKFLHPGPGFGGSCFPKDTAALVHLAERHGYDFRIVRAVMEVNENQRERMVEKIRKAVGGLRGKTLGILGLSFKPNTNDIRESPAVAIIRRVLEEGAQVRAYDPAAMDDVRPLLPEVTYARDAYDAAHGADALVLATEWNPFRNLELERLRGLLRSSTGSPPVFVDLRNVYDPEKMREAGFAYYGVGRGGVV